MAECDKTIGQRVKGLREQHQMSQQELADLIGTSREKVAKIEAGDRETKAQDIINIADHLHTTTDYLLRGKDTENIDICKDLGFSNSTVNTIRGWRTEKPAEGEPNRAECIEALEALINHDAGINFLHSLRYYLLADESKTYAFNMQQGAMEEASAFIRAGNGSYMLIHEGMIESALLNLLKDHLHGLKESMQRGQTNGQASKR